MKIYIVKNLTKSIIAVYAIGTGFSGQRFAIEMLLQGLREKGWQVEEVHTPSLDRVGEEKGAIFSFLGKLCICGIQQTLAAFSNKIVYCGLGLTIIALVREGFPLLMRSFLPLSKLGVIALNGSLFLNWSSDCLEAKLLRQITKAARYISILGPNHRHKLIELGLPESKIVIVDNTCLLESITTQEVEQKQQSNRPLKILHLSTLIETKGYLDFVEAISKLAATTDTNIEAILCGKITDRKEDNPRFPNPDDAKEWLEQQIASINSSDRVRLRWVNGAVGEEKAKLFRSAHIFVLPTRYPVEAQPIVILEALASGCAVITTKAGEISTTLSDRTAILADDYSATAIAQAITELINHRDRRQELAINGLSLFEQRFSYTKYIERWEELLNNL